MYQSESVQYQLDTQVALNAYISKVFGIMFAGLLITAFASIYTATSPAMQAAIFGNPFGFIALIIIEFILVISISAAINKISYGAALGMFFAYSVINGITLSVIFMAYELGSISMAFMVTAVTFGVMALYGMVTKTDLTKMGSMFLMVLLGGIIALFINMFIQSSAFDFVISLVLLIVFVGLVAYDTQKLKGYFYGTQNDIAMQKKSGVLGALSLYLDFVNIFLFLLRIFGKRR